MTKVRLLTAAVRAGAQATIKRIDNKRESLRLEYIKKRAGVHKFCGIPLYEVSEAEADAEWHEKPEAFIHEVQRDRAITLSTACLVTLDTTIAISVQDLEDCVAHQVLLDKTLEIRKAQLQAGLLAQKGACNCDS